RPDQAQVGARGEMGARRREPLRGAREQGDPAPEPEVVVEAGQHLGEPRADEAGPARDEHALAAQRAEVVRPPVEGLAAVLADHGDAHAFPRDFASCAATSMMRSSWPATTLRLPSSKKTSRGSTRYSFATRITGL